MEPNKKLNELERKAQAHKLLCAVIGDINVTNEPYSRPYVCPGVYENPQSGLPNISFGRLDKFNNICWHTEELQAQGLTQEAAQIYRELIRRYTEISPELKFVVNFKLPLVVKYLEGKIKECEEQE